ncbi:MAG: hypothetical protein AAF602_26680 [Myxococcota bacterium]
MDQPLDRDAVMAATTPRELFGDAADDPRELRRRYAKLLRAFPAEDDPEAHTHVRALFEQGRDAHEARPEVTAPVDDPVSIVVAALDQDGTTLLDAVEAHREVLLAQTDGDLLAAALFRLVTLHGPTLGPDAFALIESILVDARWDRDPAETDRFDVALATLRQVWAARQDEDVYVALREAFPRLWGASPVVAATVLLETGERLRGRDLDRGFAYLERRHPAALGLLVGARYRMAEAVAGHPPALPDGLLDDLRQSYPPTSESAGFALAVERQIDSLTVRIGGTLLFAVPLLAVLPIWSALIGGYALRVGAQWAAGWWLDQSRTTGTFAQVHDGDTRELVEVCRSHALFPEELGPLVLREPVPWDDHTYAFIDGHPLLALERDDSVLLKMLTPAHVQRVRDAQEAADA